MSTCHHQKKQRCNVIHCMKQTRLKRFRQAQYCSKHMRSLKQILHVGFGTLTNAEDVPPLSRSKADIKAELCVRSIYDSLLKRKDEENTMLMQTLTWQL